MRRALLGLVLVGLSLPALAVRVSHRWLLPVDQEGHQEATVVVYQAGNPAVWFPTVGTDEATGQWAWSLSIDISPAAAKGTWVIAGQDLGWVAAERFSWSDPTGPLHWVPFPAPVGRTGGLYFPLPALDPGVVDHYEVLVNGHAYPVKPGSGDIKDVPFREGCRVRMRAILIGHPAQDLLSPIVAVGIDRGAT